MGLSPHTVAAGLTLLLQVNDVQGLQIKKDGKWFYVNALNGALIVNIGDIIEVFFSERHRANHQEQTMLSSRSWVTESSEALSTTVIQPNKERISAALFHYPCENLVINPLPEFVKDGKLRYRSIRYQDLLRQYFTSQLDGRNRLERLKLEQ